MTSRARGLAILFLATALSPGCVHYWRPRVAQRPVAEQGVALFHERWNDQQFDEMYKSIGLRSRAATRMIAGIRLWRDQYGSFVSSEQMAATCEPSGLTFIYHARYSKGDVTERFAWEVYGGEAHLLLYQMANGFEDIRGDLPDRCPENN